MEKTLKEINRFVTLQRELIFALQEQFDCPKEDKQLLRWPKSGDVFLNKECWTFSKHGAGYQFTSIKSGIVVDFHDGVPDNHDLFDAWRLEQYFESLPDYNDHSIDLDDVKKWLTELERSEKITMKSEGRYKLNLENIIENP